MNCWRHDLTERGTDHNNKAMQEVCHHQERLDGCESRKDVPQIVQDVPEIAQDVSKIAHNEPKSPQDVSKIDQDVPKSKIARNVSERSMMNALIVHGE